MEQMMLVILKSIYNQYISFCNNSIFIYTFFLSIIILGFKGRENRIKIVYPSLILICVLVNPISFVKIFEPLLGGTYWRALWLIPVVPVLSVFLCETVKNANKPKWKCGIFLMCIGIVLLVGKNIYIDKRQFIKASNAYKLPQESIEIAEYLTIVDKEPKTILPQNLYCYTRQYSTAVKQIYGRDFDNYIAPWHTYADEISQSIIENIQSPQRRLYQRIRFFEDAKVNFVVDNYNDQELSDLLTTSEYIQVNCIQGNAIYYKKDVQPNNWMLLQRGYNDETERMGYVAKRTTGELVLMDGGWADETWVFDDYLAENKNSIDVWILTTLSSAHIGVFLQYAQDENVKIEEVMLSRECMDWLRVASPEQYVELEDALKKCKKITWLELEKKYNIFDLRLVPVCATLNAETKIPSMAFVLVGSEDAVLFCADIIEQDFETILTSIQKYSIDIIEVSCHGETNYTRLINAMKPVVILMDCSSEIAQSVEAYSDGCYIEKYDFSNPGYIELK